MNRPTRLLWIIWMGACIIGGLAGSQLPSARKPLPVWLIFGVLGGCWTMMFGAILKRRISRVIAWIIERVLFLAMYIPFLAAFVALYLCSLVSDRATALVWAASIGAVLGLASSLLIRPYLSTQAQRRWMIVNICCGMLALLLAVVFTHPLATLVPDLRSSLTVGVIISAGWGIVPGTLLASLLQTLPPSSEEVIQLRLSRTVSVRRRWVERIVVIIIVVAAVVGVYRGRCELIACQPVTWAGVLDLAQTQATKVGPSYQVAAIRAEPAFRSDLTADGPYDITIRIDLTSSQADLRDSGMHPSQTIEFNDREQLVRWTGQSGTSEQPSLETQRRLSRVRVSPRDVYRMTWQAAQRELSATIRLSASSMRLYTDDLPQERFGIESAWAISYHDDADYLTYWIDAQSGEVVQQTKER